MQSTQRNLQSLPETRPLQASVGKEIEECQENHL